jgi:Ca2+-binding EF-hand superfamily protein
MACSTVAFRVFDVDEDNLVGQEDMLTILQEAVGEVGKRFLSWYRRVL